MSAPRFGLYLHWPFCKSKCPYCDFNSHVRATLDEARWRRALLTELDHWAAETAGRKLDSIFFGGGTPSLMAPETVAAVIARAREHWTFANDIEITLEANPTSVEAARFAELAEAGADRLSLGVQSLDDSALRFLGRQHSAEEALAALDLARRHFPRFSFDLIYARPEQSAAAWRAELSRALALAGGHLSLYQLTIEENTPFHGAVRRGELRPLAEEPAESLFELTQEMTADAGLPAYEISNHARPGGECRHNLIYWQGGDYLGIGPGAHGRVTLPLGDRGAQRYATRQHRAPEAWLTEVEAKGHATRERRALAPEEIFEELLLTGLRLADGIAEETVVRLCDAPFERLFAPERLAALIEEGLLLRDARGLRATARGRLALNAVIAYLAERRAVPAA